MLATFIEAYEAEHYPIDPPDPIEAITFRMEHALTRKYFEAITGTRSRIAEFTHDRAAVARKIRLDQFEVSS